ncbi:MAG: heavy-metal-associated domain-containing protein [Treponema sp.]|nr:heavy-metal-associated domain-containing protein [Treponema sp.]
MNMGTIIIILVLLSIVVVAIFSIRKRIKYGSACCGTRDASPKKIRVRDKNKSHYPYTYTLTVDGMHCSNCATRVENALNAKEGIWASVKLETKSVLVRSKNPIERDELFRAISEAGYTLIKID